MDAEDIVQQAFLSLWKKTETVEMHTAARAYLYKTVYNASLDYLKHQKVKRRYEAEMKSSPPAITTADPNWKEERSRIEAAVKELPEGCRKIFMMSRVEGLRYKEIAAALGISEKTVENQLGKALKILRERLTQC